MRFGSGLFRCGIDLPAGATIKSLQVAGHDGAPDARLGPCHLSLVRVDEVGEHSVGLHDVIATINGTLNEATPGPVELRTTSIAAIHEEINDEHAYWVDCTMNEVASDVGIYGVTVTYEIARGR